MSLQTSPTDCPICLNEIGETKNRCITTCGHTFCFTCIITSMNRSNKCPLCRNELWKEKKGPTSSIGSRVLFSSRSISPRRRTLFL